MMSNLKDKLLILLLKPYKRKWRFRPHTAWPFVMWGLTLFFGLKIVVLPLIEGVYNYFSKTNEIKQLQTQYLSMQKQNEDMQKKRNYMLTPSYIVERAHEMGLVKPEESQMVVIEGIPQGTTVHRIQPKRTDFRD